MQPISYARRQFPAEVIRHAVWMYLRFTLSYRDVEELLAERGIVVTYESIRRWVLLGRSGCRSAASGTRFRRDQLECREEDYPPFTAPAVSPATICRCAKIVSSSTGSVTISAAAASGPQLSCSKDSML
jgi:hypothetical protein